MSESAAPAEAEHHPPDVEQYVKPGLARAEFIRLGQSYLADIGHWVQTANARLTGRQVTQRFARAHDALLRAAWQHQMDEWSAARSGADAAPPLALVAVGGYGRQEQFLRSDVDILFVMDKSTPEVEEILKPLLHLLIDLRLNLGYGTRTVQECVARVGLDLESATAMITSRLVIGAKSLYQRYWDAVAGAFAGRGRKWFLRAIYQEWHARRDKYQSTIYLLEPNVKEGPGGLRDVHSVIWTLFGLTGAHELKDLTQFAKIDEDQLRHYREAISMIETVRNELHIVAGGKNDQLGFQFQPEIARRLGYKEDGFRLPEEVFMADYYRHARTIDRVSSRAFLTMTRQGKSALDDLVGTLRRKKIDAHLYAQGNVLSIAPDAPDYFESDPSRILGIFERVTKTGYRLSLETLDALARTATKLGPAFRLEKKNHECFMRILKGPWHVARAIGDMHACGVLDKFMPEFARLQGMVRIDHYHHYTVDEHTIKALEMLERLLREPEGQRSFAADVARRIERIDLLNLALLLHDIGKGYGRGHALRGGQVAQRVGERLGLAAHEIELVRFLVLSHLKVTHAALRRDLSDPNIAGQLAEELGTPDRLDLLYVHSVCDLMAVSPEAWNDWKDKLLQECYIRTSKVLRGQAPADELPTPNLTLLRDRVIEALPEALPETPPEATPRNGETRLDTKSPALKAEVDDFLSHVSTRYLQAMAPPGIARHFLMRRTLDSENVVAWWLHPDPGTGFSDLHICAFDAPGLFCSICGALAAKEINIWSAQIFSTRGGLALNHFQVTDLEKKPLPAGLRLERLRQDLNQVLLGTKTIDELIEKHRGRSRARPRRSSPLRTRIQIDNESSQQYTVIEIRATDRPGLLYSITKALNESQINIQRALINTESYGVSDVFYVTDLEYNKVYDTAHMEQIEKALGAAIDAGTE